MIGAPKWLNTKEDVVNAVNYAKQGIIDKNDVIKRLTDLFSDEKVWVYKQDVDSTYKPADSTEKVMQVDDMESQTTKYVLYTLQDNPDARFLRMGLTKDEIENYINELKEA